MIRVLLLVLLLSPAMAGAQTSDEFFDSRTLHDVRLYIHSGDLRELREGLAGALLDIRELCLNRLVDVHGRSCTPYSTYRIGFITPVRVRSMHR